MIKKPKYPPTLQEYVNIQLEYPDFIVAMEIGDFYEIFQVNDSEHGKVGHAAKVSEMLDIRLTKRHGNVENSPLLCGIPSHVAENYFQKLVNNNIGVVVVEQEVRGKSKDNNTQLKRKISKILTKGTAIDYTNKESNLYFASLYKEKNELLIGISLVDFSTGEVKITEANETELIDLMIKYNPKEILFSGSFDRDLIDRLSVDVIIHLNSDKKILSKISSIEPLFKDVYGNKKLDIDIFSKLGLNYWRHGSLALGNLINYLIGTEYHHLLLKKIAEPDPIFLASTLFIPFNGLKNLDLEEKANSNYSFFNKFNICQTAMGARLFKSWIYNPSTNLDIINTRLSKIETYSKLEEHNYLKEIYDIQRLLRRMIFGKLSIYEINNLYHSIKASKHIFKLINLKKYDKELNIILKDIEDNIEINDSFNTSEEGNIFSFLKGKLLTQIKDSYSDWQEKQELMVLYKTKIDTIIGYDKSKIVEKRAEYSLEYPKSKAAILKQHKIEFNEKVSIISIESKEWKNLQISCFGAKEKYLQLAEEMFVNFQKYFHSKYTQILYKISNEIAEFDILYNYSIISKERNYVKPIFSHSDQAFFKAKKLRHPIVELNNCNFVPNDIEIGIDHNINVIYGPNSAGKSTILKSVSISIILAQMGLYVPAESLELSVFDAILTRMSSNDNIEEGQSTFVLEMNELQQSLKYIEKKSLLLLDEIGRGTSVDDGESLAFATLMYLSSNKNNSLTFFATHYHNLYEKIKTQENIKIYNIHSEIIDKKLVFTRILEEGVGHGSYGLLVAENCLIPASLIRLAKNYKNELSEVKKSNYNSNKFGTLCEVCKKNPATETHHIIEQKQGKVKSFTDALGIKRSIHHIENLKFVCSNCHDEITRESNLKNEKE